MNETQLIEKYLFKRLNVEDQLFMEAKLLTDPEFKCKLKWQSRAHEIVKAHGQKILRQEIISVENRLFSELRFQNFRATIFKIFK
ncbi:MAG: hypothetical protein JNJ40_06070 [Bacteroidia bacterium]|nr:hypothetical protein [Bacteroidia bacterium]